MWKSNEKKIEILQKWVEESSRIVFFSGPGLSRESGIPDFLSVKGSYYDEFQYPPEAILSRSFLERKPAEFFRFFREKILEPLTTAEPNPAHRKLAELDASGKLLRIITQNMDGLHQEAGVRNVLELCGSVMRNNCPLCERRVTVYDIYQHPDVLYCDVDMCGAFMRPEIVLYGDAPDPGLMTQAAADIQRCDLLIVAGTSLSAQPAAGLTCHYWRRKLVLINEKRDPADRRADLLFRAPVCEIMEQIRI